jgi:hypothetical protein
MTCKVGIATLGGCPEGMIAIDVDPTTLAIDVDETTLCERDSCDLTAGTADTSSCCENKGTCAGYVCPNEEILISPAPTSPCAGRECVDNECCVDRAPCSDFDCVAQGQVVKKNADGTPVAGLLCAGESCIQNDESDKAECCAERAECAANVCSTISYFTGSDLLCADVACDTTPGSDDEWTCCTEKAFCSSKDFDCADGYGEKLDDTIRCA